MSEPTKGPYRAGPAYENEPGIWQVLLSSESGIAFALIYGRTKEQALANADLLAAAPELREALRWCLNNSEESLGDHPWQMGKVRAALAKADGKEKL